MLATPFLFALGRYLLRLDVPGCFSLQLLAAGGLAAADLPDHAHGLRYYAAAHLAGAVLAVVEDDRGFLDLEAHLVGAVGDLYLERVAVGADVVQVERFQYLAAECLEAAGQVAVG